MDGGTGGPGGGVGTSAWRSFCCDTAASARTWTTHPGLPLLTLLVWLPISLPGAWRSIIFLPILLFAVGFCGMQREWYAAAFAGERPSAGRVWRGTWGYLPRLFPVGVFVVLLPGLLIVVLLPLLGMVNHSTDPDAFLVRVRVAFIVQAFVVDFLLTFVMPALVFTTGNTVTALRIGVRYLRRTWPTTKWHVLVPPTAIIAIGQAASGPRGGLLLGTAISLSGAMLGLLFKGAQLRAYFDHAAELDVPIGEPGGALPPKPATSNETILSMRRRRAEAAREHRAKWGDG